MSDEYDTYLDKKIKRDLEAQAKELDTLVSGGVIDYMKMGFASNYTLLMKMGYVIAIILSLLMFYCGYHFFTGQKDEQLFWGVLFLLTFNGQVATKLWIFMQTNRNILSRELRLMERRLASRV